MQIFRVFVNAVDVFAVYLKGLVRFAYYVFPYIIITHGKHFVIDSHFYNTRNFGIYFQNIPLYLLFL